MSNRPDVDEARLRPHLRSRQPVLQPVDSGITHIQTLNLGATKRSSTTAVGEPGDLRGIPAIARGVGGASPGTRPDSDAHLTRLDKHRAA